MTLIARGWKPEQARSVLPNSLKTEIAVTANVREWRCILGLRTAATSHPQMRELMSPLLTQLQADLPEVFDDLPAPAGL
jgi:thymidylate synthase (FAD)